MVDVAAQAEMFANRLRKNARRLSKWCRREGVSCYRLYDRDIPELPFAVDWYQGRLHVAEYQRKGSPEGAAHVPWLAALMEAAAAAMSVPQAAVFLKHRARQRGLAQYERFAARGAWFRVQEGGLSFEINLSDYLDTGLFLDHRNLRARVREEAAGRRVLNLFSYTGAFSVHAAAGRAASTTSVDLSNTYSAWAARNLRQNGFAGDAHRALAMDVRAFLDEERGPWDLAIVDPPTFSNSKRMGTHVFDVQRDHGGMLRAVLQRMAPGGVVYFSTNFTRFRLDEARLSGYQTTEITAETIPVDFRNKKIHRSWRILSGERT